MKLDPDKSIFEYKVRPIFQALAVLAIIILVCGIAQLAILVGWFSFMLTLFCDHFEIWDHFGFILRFGIDLRLIWD